MTLAELVKMHAPLGDRIEDLRPVQKQAIADAAFELGVIEVQNALEVSTFPMERAMQASGYLKCAGCESWFLLLDINEDSGCCEDCAMADVFYAEPEPKPEEPAPAPIAEQSEPQEN
jgi:hypothetical protein